MKYSNLYQNGVNKLEAAGIADARIDARLLLQHVCRITRNDLLVHGDREAAEAQEAEYMQLIQKRAARIPLQHLTGTQDFMGLTFRVSDQVLIPRQDTENLVEEVMKELHDGMRILDMCTGSGCILLSLLHYSNDCTGVGADLSEDALLVARKNAAELGFSLSEQTPEEQVTFIQSDLFEKVEGKFDRIVSNPPYIQSDVIEELEPEVRDHEPRMALDGMQDGLFFYRKISEEAREHLERGGMLYYEIGYDEKEAVMQILQECGYRDIYAVQDFGGNDRVVCGTW